MISRSTLAKPLIAASLMMTGACVQVIPEGGASPTGPCDASRAQSLIGRSGTGQLGADALRRTGARDIRWIQPGQAVTMDFRADRLNIELDAGNRVVRFTCG
ncbi:MAG: hypothetical protein H0W74_02925 [Sphingosinicella sp.]|nr:hypothetical protein [Sphingosinicella sp.]